MITRTRIMGLALATVAGAGVWGAWTSHAVATTPVASHSTANTQVATQNTVAPMHVRAPKTTTTTAAPATTTTTVAPAPQGIGPWSDRELLITPSSLGAVQVGMSLKQAEKAAGYLFDEQGDGFIYPTTLPKGYGYDFVGDIGDVGPTLAHVSVRCVGSFGADSKQTVVTPEGFRLGDNVQHLLAIYGSSAKHVPAPATGYSTLEGYVVAEHGGYLAFATYNHKVVGIEGTTKAALGGTTFDQNSCSG